MVEKPKAERVNDEQPKSDDIVVLPPMQEEFVVQFTRCRNGAEAARRAGYSRHTARIQASRLLTNANILAEIQRRTKDNAMELDEALSRLADIARGSMEDFVSFTYEPYPDFVLDLGKARERGVLHLIKKLKYNKDGLPEIELYGADDASKFIAQLHKTGPSGKEDDPFHIKVIEGPKDVR